MTVATALAVSWNPFTNSKLRARPRASRRKSRCRRRESARRVPFILRLTAVLPDDPVAGRALRSLTPIKAATDAGVMADDNAVYAWQSRDGEAA